MKFRLLLPLLAALSVLGPKSGAVVVVWSGTTDGNLATGINWVGNLVPAPGDDVVFDASTSTTLLIPDADFGNVSFGSSRPSYTLEGTGPTPTLTLSGGVSLTPGATVAMANTLTLSLTSGLHTASLDSAGANPTYLNVYGAITGSGGLVLASTGPTTSPGITEPRGVLQLFGNSDYAGGTTVNGGYLILQGGTIDHAGADTIVNKPNSETTGRLEILAGGTLTNDRGVLGDTAGHRGEAHVIGTGSRWHNEGEFIAAHSGDANLQISGGGEVTADSDIHLGYNAGTHASVFVSDQNSKLTTVSSLSVGKSGEATLNVTSAATVRAESMIYIGRYATGVGGVHVAGSATETSTLEAISGLYVGEFGQGTLTVARGGVVRVASGGGAIQLADVAGSVGDLYIGAGSMGSGGGGILQASTVTSGAGTGRLVFQTEGFDNPGPYYFTQDGLASGAAVTIAGTTEVTNYSGYNVVKGANTYTGGTQVTGGTLVAQGPGNVLGTAGVAVNGGTLRLEGTGLSNVVTVNAGSLVLDNADLYTAPVLNSGRLSGNGFVNSATIGQNFTLTPGFDGNGWVGELMFDHLTLASGGTLEWNLRNPNGSNPGIDWDFINVPTSHTLVVSATNLDRFTLKLISLALADHPGTTTGFVPGQGYSWLVFYSDSLSGFAPDKFDLDLSAFVTDAGPGAFSLVASGTSVYLNFTPVPEPSTYALIAAGLLPVLAGLRRRAKRQR